MSIDLSQFHQVFLEESFEGLDIMESALMDLDVENIDSETINAIFRAAHSIKGGSATFGFSEIAEFTHVLETLLDQVRAGTRNIDVDEVDLYLQSVDAMREMLSIVQNGDNKATEKSEDLKEKFNNILSGGAKVLATPPQAKASPAAKKASSKRSLWKIEFLPDLHLLKTGNDPAKIFRSLAELGALKVEAIIEQMPTLEALDPENLFIKWQLELDGSVAEHKIKELFEWVEDDAKVDMTLIESETSAGDDAASSEQDTNNAIEPQWHIHFVPNVDVLKAGNDICKLLSALKDLTKTYSAQVQLNRLPELKLLDPENCYLSWDIVVSGDLSEAAINEVFEWVVDESVVHIEQIDRARIDQDKGVTSAEPSGNSAPKAQATAKAAKKSVAQASKKSAAQETSSIRVGIDKIDNLINMVGELVITQSMLGQLGTDFDVSKTPKLLEGLSQLEQNTRELQESVMRIRMLPISFAFSRFPRMVRDVGQQLNKKIQLEMRGEQTELDKTVMEKIGDPLVHLVRNAIDHGIELPEERRNAGKSETGNVVLNAYHQGGNVVIEITDDGRGLDRAKLIAKAQEKGILQDVDPNSLSDEQVFDLIFHPGFSTAQQVSDLSGRGVGMDVVRRNIQALNGVVEIQSKPGEGSTIRIRLPLTLAILDGQLVRVGGNTYIFPLVSIVESIQCNKDQVNHIAGGCSVFKLRDDYVPIVKLHEVFGVTPDSEELEQALMVVVESDGDKVGIVVDELLAQQQVVIKSLEQNYRRIEGVSGATILGDGTVSLIIDIPGVVKVAGADTATLNDNHAFVQYKRQQVEREVAQHA